MDNIGRAGSWRCLGLLWAALLVRPAAAQSEFAWGPVMDGRPAGFAGGLPGAPDGDCISAEERARVAWNIALFHARYRLDDVRIQAEPGGPSPYAFHPQAGTLWDDLRISAFTDQDKSSGIRDWDCSEWTFDGHRGIDSAPRSFAEQDAGMPVFAALDGTVVDAHDGEFDKQTAWTGARANYVILFHGGSHYTYYWHLKYGSVAVAIHQVVKAGTQLGLTGSSGQTTGPHLHFESQYAGSWYEPYGGPCSGPSYWIRQVPIRRDTMLRDFNVTDVNPADYPPLPYDLPRKGTFVIGSRSVAFRIQILNLPTASTSQIRFFRPDGSLARDAGSGTFGNPYPWTSAWAWWRYNLMLDTVGTWHIELIVNGQSLASAPLEVVASAGQMVNRPPSAIAAVFDPPKPRDGDVLFCRLTSPLVLSDADYDLVRYRYQWRINGQLARDVTTAARSDALVSGLSRTSDVVQCTVTPTDGMEAGPPATVSAIVGFVISGAITENGVGLSGVTISAGGRSTMTAGDGSYQLVGLAAGSYTVIPTRSGYGFTPVERTVKLGPDATGTDFRADGITGGVKAVTVSPLSAPGPASAVGTVTLDAPAPPGGAVVALSSDRPAIVRVPASVTVPEGATIATFPVTATEVVAATPVVIAASRNGVTRSVTFTVSAAKLATLVLTPGSVMGGSVVVGAVTLGEPAPAGGLVVTLSSDNAQVAAVPSSVLVPADVRTAFFLVMTAPVQTATRVALRATAGDAHPQAVLQVLPP